MVTSYTGSRISTILQPTDGNSSRIAITSGALLQGAVTLQSKESPSLAVA